MKRLVLVILASFAFIVAAAQEFGVVNISVCNMRATPDFDAEMVSQALLGTPVHILEINSSNSWPNINTPDEYRGWVHRDVVTLMSEEDYHAWNAAPKVVVTSLFGIVYEKASRHSQVLSDVVAGDRLVMEGGTLRYWKVRFPDGRRGYISKNDASPLASWRKSLDKSADAIISTARSMLGFPYIWAGMSPKGMDCSGFVRTVLFMHDIIIPRDSGPMSRKGERIYGTANLQKGDLVFFGRNDTAAPRVSHVGIYIGDGLFIHSLGMVKIGSFNPRSPQYDAYNSGRYLFASRILPYIGVEEGLCTTEDNPFYNE